MGTRPPDLPQPWSRFLEEDLSPSTPARVEADPFDPHGFGEEAPGPVAKAAIVGLIVFGVSLVLAAIFWP